MSYKSGNNIEKVMINKMCSKFKLRIFICVLLCCVCNDVHAIKLLTSINTLSKNSSLHQSSSNVTRGLNLNEEQMRKLHIWTLGVIPYYIDDLSFDKALRDKIRLYFDNVNGMTGLLFTEIPRPPEDEESRWVFFINRRGQFDCDDIAFHNFSKVGVQRIVLGYDCIANGKMSPVILSLIGVPPQHNAPNRNEFITINEKNILPDKLYLFEKVKDDVWLFNNNLTYDYNSAGHYCTHKYTSNGGDTITYVSQPEKVENLSEGLVTELSLIDLIKINMLYKNTIKKRKTSANVPGCDKLFHKDSKSASSKSNTTDYVDSSQESNEYPEPQEARPTEKPYITDAVFSFTKNSSGQLMDKSGNDYDDDNEDENISNNQLSTENNADLGDNQVEVPNKKEGVSEVKNDIDEENNEKLSQKLFLDHLKKKENILEESDYKTDDENNKK